jgi:phosphatidylglycerophosphate synthase
MVASRTWLTRANGLTLVRLLCTPALAVAILGEATLAAGLLFTVAVATDFTDGWVARRYGEATPLGGLVDHGVDALFVVVCCSALVAGGVLPLALPLLIAAAFAQYTFDSRQLTARGPRPSQLGRWFGIAYYVIVGIPVVRDAIGWSWPSAGLVRAIGWALVATTLASIIDRLRLSLAAE